MIGYLVIDPVLRVNTIWNESKHWKEYLQERKNIHQCVDHCDQ